MYKRMFSYDSEPRGTVCVGMLVVVASSATVKVGAGGMIETVTVG
jgi:hypothetical protein